MSEYVELYKKYRPRTWDDVIGQDTVVNSIKESVLTNKIPTAYLLSGPAGTGKTTIAKILSKSLNCEHIDDKGNPCNECSTCKAIDSDTQMGIEYVSMANNGSVDDIRRIMTEARLSQPIKKQIWILDEVQNLSSAAQDAMLIGLEADSQKTLFILCTTDPQKIKPAILSRVQQRALAKVDFNTLAKHLVGIVKNEDIKDKIKKDDIIACVSNADGSVRNAIRNLEMVVSSGKLPLVYSKECIKMILTKDPLKIYEVTEKMNEEGLSATTTLEQCYKDFVHILKIKAGLSSNDKEMEELASHLNGNLVLQCIEECSKTLTSISNKVVDSGILLEILLTKLTLMYKKTTEKKG